MSTLFLIVLSETCDYMTYSPLLYINLVGNFFGHNTRLLSVWPFKLLLMPSARLYVQHLTFTMAKGCCFVCHVCYQMCLAFYCKYYVRYSESRNFLCMPLVYELLKLIIILQVPFVPFSHVNCNVVGSLRSPFQLCLEHYLICTFLRMRHLTLWTNFEHFLNVFYWYFVVFLFCDIAESCLW